MRPNDSGSTGWGGATWDQETALLYVKSSDMPTIAKIEKFDKESARNPVTKMSDADYVGGPMNTPVPATFMNGLPLQKPPYATLTAIDLNRGDFRWRIVFGKGSDFIRNHPALKGVTLPERLGTLGNPSAIVTKGGLLFIGGGDKALYALDKATGQQVWEYPLPRRASGTPMTYRSRSGRQVVVIATGGGGDASLVAFALPQAQ
jgi:glucose dehydrogenase